MNNNTTVLNVEQAGQDDIQCAIHALNAASTRSKPSTNVMSNLTGPWYQILLAAKEDGRPGIDRIIEAEKVRDPKAARRIQDAIDAASKHNGSLLRPNESFDNPRRLARLFVGRKFVYAGKHILRYWQDQWMVWENGFWQEIGKGDIKALTTREIQAEFDLQNLKDQEAFDNGTNSGGGKPRARPKLQDVTTRIVNNTLLNMEGVTHLSEKQKPCDWLEGVKPPLKSRTIIPTPTKLIGLEEFMEDLPCTAEPTPDFFNTFAYGFPFNPKADPPARWLQFLEEIFPNDPDSIRCLQQWFGYLLGRKTSRQAIMMMIGKPGSGKGTVTRVLNNLLGAKQVAAIRFSTLANDFGMAEMVDKPAAIIYDARPNKRVDLSPVLEILLSISGQDPVPINRKHKDIMTVELPTRLMLVTNLTPEFKDSSNALTDRLIALRFRQRFERNKNADIELSEKLAKELEGIGLWALKGYQDLERTGHFVQPESGKRVLDEMKETSNPVGSFIRECCKVVEPEQFTFVQDVFDAWKAYCSNKNIEPGSVQEFGAQLSSCDEADGIEVRQKRQGEKRDRAYFGLIIVNNPISIY